MAGFTPFWFICKEIKELDIFRMGNKYPNPGILLPVFNFN
jgi:hypothetical protein